MVKNIAFLDSSRLITESLVQSGADVFVGYPITPANLLYMYAGKRFPQFIAAPDEISTLQMMTGLAATGKIPVTATSFPGFALMIESINMAYMMELPMVIVLVQRLGPATGTATCGAQGDVSIVNGIISGGFAIPTMSISNTSDCWTLPAKAVEMAVKMRTPVIIFTSKEEVMTQHSVNLSRLEDIRRTERKFYSLAEKYIPYKADENLVPEFLPLTNNQHQVRLTASTHDKHGIIQNTSDEALENTRRLHRKILHNIKEYVFFEYDKDMNAKVILVSFGITSLASRVAVQKLKSLGIPVSLLLVKTLLPVPQAYYEILEKYSQIFIAEENLTGQYRQLLFGNSLPGHIHGINKIGKMIEPEEIISIINSETSQNQ
jgi:2-oxoglutarate/2-oxoacid ferredoxin oxidoreductase subunit alpha